MLSCTPLHRLLSQSDKLRVDLNLPASTTWLVRTTDGQLHVIIDTMIPRAIEPGSPTFQDGFLNELRDCVEPGGKIRSDSRIAQLFKAALGASVSLSYTDCITIFPPPDYSHLRELRSRQTEELIRTQAEHQRDVARLQGEHQRTVDRLEADNAAASSRAHFQDKQRDASFEKEFALSQSFMDAATKAKLDLALALEKADDEQAALAQQRDAALERLAELNLLVAELQRQLVAAKGN